jgi:hypothetical protein
MLVLEQACRLFEQQGRGQIVAIGSVAGDRGRATNYSYGAAKGAHPAPGAAGCVRSRWRRPWPSSPTWGRRAGNRWAIAGSEAAQRLSE